MKEIVIQGLSACKKCGNISQVKLFSNSRHQFQVKCDACGNHTSWTSKTGAIIAWFNQWF